MNKKLPVIVVILGPTASGKTKLAVKLAQQFSGEIISADSRQVYKGMDIGSGKDLKEYKNVKHYLLDVVSPRQTFTLSRFQKLTDQAIKQITAKNKLPILCGGSGLYAEAVFDGYLLSTNKVQPDIRKKLTQMSLSQLQKKIIKYKDQFNNSDWHNSVRLIRFIENKNNLGTKKQTKYQPYIFAVKIDKDNLKINIVKRLNDRLKEGLIEEIKNLHQSGVSWKKLESFGLEYKLVSYYVQDKISLASMKDLIVKDSLNFAKRQITWLNRPALKNRVVWVNNYTELKNKILDLNLSS